MPTVRWGMIGAGSVTETKSGPALHKAEGSALVAVMRRSGDLARDYALRHGIPRWYDDAGALVRDPEVDAVYIATPPSSHHAYALMCARAGKHVYVEKPMALTSAECREMIDACAQAGVGLFVAYYRRALERFRRIRALVQGGAIGEVRAVNIALRRTLLPDERDPARRPWRVVPEIAGGGHFVDLGSHMLDLVDYICGPVRAARGFASNQAGAYAAEDIVTGALVCEGGVHVAGSWCFTSFERLDRTEIVGSDGTITFATFRPEPVRLITQSGAAELAFDDPEHIQQPLIETVIQAINGAGGCPSTGETAARTTWAMEQLIGPYYGGQP